MFKYITINLFKLAPKNTFKKVSTNSDIIIGGTSRFLFKKKLIQYETMIYSFGLGVAQQDILLGGTLKV